MAKYSWDIEELIKKRNEVTEQYKRYEELKDLYEELIENYSKKFCDDEISEDCNIGKKIYNVQNLKQEWDEIPKESLSLINGAMDAVYKFDSNFVKPYFSPLNISDEELVEITRELFKKLPDEYFLRKFDEFTDPNKHLLHIRNYKTIPTDELGLTYTDPELHTSYGLVSRHKSIQDIITLGHEIFHMIVRESEEPLFWDTNKPIFTETEGFFANLLFSDMLRYKGYKASEFDRFDRKDLVDNIDTIRTSFIINNAFNLIEENGNINFRKLSPILRKKKIAMPVNKTNFAGLFDEDLIIYINHAISYLTALDLFELYKKDPEKTLYTVKTIPLLNGDNPQKDLENIGATFYEDGYINLENHCKKLLKTKTTSNKK